MGETVCRAVEGADDMALVGRADPLLETALIDVLGDADVVVDFSTPDTALENARHCLDAGVHCVMGTSGADFSSLAGVGSANLFVAPNFAIGAVLMQRFAEQAIRYLPDAEIIELHHQDKPDAPSGTAMATARRMAAARGAGADHEPGVERVSGARGGDVEGIRVHSVRLPGSVAHQEVLLGGQGQTLTIRHDSTDWTSFMPGVVMAVKAVASRPGLTVGLDALLGQE
jgi:4-hydroxy-tetrahydrodipicolinate reductase